MRKYLAKLINKISAFDIRPQPAPLPPLLNSLEQQLSSGEIEAGLATCMQIISLYPTNRIAISTGIDLASAVGDISAAMNFIGLGRRFYPDDPSIEICMGMLQKLLGNTYESQKCYLKALKIDPENQTAKHLLAGLNGGGHSLAAPDEYIEGLFNSYAPTFEHVLVDRLKYAGPITLVAMLQPYLAQEAIEALDLGCGTGLFGSEINNKCNVHKLIGVDLAAEMLLRAQGKNVYDELIQSEIVTFLGTNEYKYDVIGITDVILYIGDLAKLFLYLPDNLKPGGYVAICGEELNASSKYDLQLQPTGRYQHKWQYICRIAAENGFKYITHKLAPLRRENTAVVQGNYVILQKQV